MVIKIYADLLFLFNFITDYLLLRITALLLKRVRFSFRLPISAAFGALCACVTVFCPFVFCRSLLFAACCATIMVFIAFGKQTLHIFLKRLCLFYAVAAFFFGTLEIFLQKGVLTAKSGLLVGFGVIYAPYPIYTLLFLLLASIPILRFAADHIKTARIRANYLFSVSVTREDTTISDTALYDTGNFLKEPLTQQSVMVAEWDCVKPLFENLSLPDAITRYPECFIYIPCRSMGKRNGMFAFLPDNVSSDKLCIDSPIYVGIVEGKLSADTEYRMILPNDLEYKTERVQ